MFGLIFPGGRSISSPHTLQLTFNANLPRHLMAPGEDDSYTLTTFPVYRPEMFV